VNRRAAGEDSVGRAVDQHRGSTSPVHPDATSMTMSDGMDAIDHTLLLAEVRVHAAPWGNARGGPAEVVRQAFAVHDIDGIRSEEPATEGNQTRRHNHGHGCGWSWSWKRSLIRCIASVGGQPYSWDTDGSSTVRRVRLVSRSPPRRQHHPAAKATPSVWSARLTTSPDRSAPGSPHRYPGHGGQRHRPGRLFDATSASQSAGRVGWVTSSCSVSG
jgi:hypothetical protein